MRIVLVLLLVIASQSVLAEGGSCPAGYYPIGGQGASGCAPIPGESTQTDGRDRPPPGVWRKTWGAIAFSTSNGAVGLAAGQRTEQEAETAALLDCRAAGGGSGCWVDMRYHNQCAAIAWGINFGTASGAETKDIASERAIANCSKKTSSCKVVYVGCSEPILEF